MIVLEDNFLALIFDDRMSRPYGNSDTFGRGDLLILNLASRKKFWLKRSQIENKMKAKVYEDGGDGAQYDYDELRVDDSMIEEMKVGKHEIEIKYKLDYRYGGGFLTLGSLKAQNSFQIRDPHTRAGWLLGRVVRCVGPCSKSQTVLKFILRYGFKIF